MTTQTVTLQLRAQGGKIVATEVRGVREEVQRTGDATERTGRQTAAGARRMDEYGAASQRTEARAKGLADQLNVVRGAVAALGLGVAVRQATRYADSYTQITSRLKLATESQEEFALAEARVFAIARDTRGELDATATLYARLEQSTDDLSISQDRLLGITETVNQTFAISGASVTEQSNAIRQLTQGLAGGTLRAEEFNSVIENSPRLAQALADGLGIGIGELRAQVNAGEVSVQRLVSAIEASADSVAADFASIGPTVSQSLGVLNDAIARYIGQRDQVNGVSGELAQGILTLADNVDVLADGVVILAGGLAGRLVGSLAASASAAGLFAGQVTLATAAARGLSGAVALIGGPIGVAVTAAAALSVFGNRIREAEQANLDAAVAAYKNRDAVVELGNALDAIGETSGATIRISQEAIILRERIGAQREALVELEGLQGRQFETLRENGERTLATLRSKVQSLIGLQPELAEFFGVAATQSEQAAAGTQAFADASTQLQAQIAAYAGGADAVAAYNREQKIASEVARLGKDATEAEREQLTALVADLFDAKAAYERKTTAQKADKESNDALRDSLNALREESLTPTARALADYNNKIALLDSAQAAGLLTDPDEYGRLASAAWDAFRAAMTEGADSALDEQDRIAARLQAQLDERISDVAASLQIDIGGGITDDLRAEFEGLEDLGEVFEGIGGRAEASIGKIIEASKQLAVIQEDGAEAGFGAYAKFGATAGQAIQAFAAQGSSEFEALGVVIQGLQTVSAVAAVANTAATAPFPLNFAAAASMAALMSSFGIALSGGSAGSGGTPLNEQRQAAQGRGTILGDTDAQSESVTAALDAIADSNDAIVGINRQMLDALNSLAGQSERVAAGLAQIGGTSGFGFGANAAGIEDPRGLFETLTAFGTARRDSGLAIDAGSLLDALTEPAVRAYADFANSPRQFDSLDADIERGINGVLGNIGDAVLAGVDTLGGSAEAARRRLAAIDFDTLLISLEGLDGDELEEAINSVFSTVADQVAAGALPLLDEFQRVGEGLFETLGRVTANVATARAGLARAGQSVAVRGEQPGFTFNIGNRPIKVGARTAEDVARDTIEISNALIEASGGLGEFADNVGGFVDAFRTDTERLAVARADAERALSSLGLAVPDSREEFAALVDSIQITDAASAQLYAGLLELAPVLDDLFSRTEALTRAAYDFDTALGIVDGLDPLRDALADVGLTLAEARGQAESGLPALQEYFAGLSEADRAGLQPFTDQILALIPASEQAAAGLGEVARDLSGLRTSLRDEIALIGVQGADADRIRLDQRLRDLRAQAGDDGATLALIEQLGALQREQINAAETSRIQAEAERLATEQDNAAATAERELAAERERIASERAGLERRLLQLQGDTAALRADELAALDPANRSLLARIFALQDEQAAADAAARAEQELAAERDRIASERAGLERRLLQLQGDTAALRADELAALDPANRSLLTRIFALQDEQAAADAAARARAGLTRQLEDETARVQRAAADITASLAQVTSAVAGARDSLASAITGLRRQAPGFDLAAAAQQRIDSLRANLGTGTADDQIKRVSALQSAIIERYEAEAERVRSAISEQRELAAAQQRARDAERERFSQLKAQLLDVADALRLDATSPLTARERFDEAASAFRNTLASARSGDVDALSALSGAAQTFQRENAGFFGSSQQGVEIFNEIQRGLRSVSAVSAVPDQRVAIVEPVGLDERTLSTLRQQAIEELSALDGTLTDLLAAEAERAATAQAELGARFDAFTAELVGQGLTADAALTAQQDLVAQQRQFVAEQRRTNQILTQQLDQVRQDNAALRAQQADLAERNERLARELAAERDTTDTAVAA